ncbi:MAG: hypothetical protein P0S94_01950 [Simkaniaceae bacterium]|nr:hypothetical protein [Simkaniaceae bacterium]
MKRILCTLTATASIFSSITSWDAATQINTTVEGTPQNVATAIDASGNGAALYNIIGDSAQLVVSVDTIIEDVDGGETITAPINILSGSASPFMAVWSVEDTTAIKARTITSAGTLGTVETLATENLTTQVTSASTPAGNFLVAWGTSGGFPPQSIRGKHYNGSAGTWGDIITINGAINLTSMQSVGDASGTFLVVGQDSSDDLQSHFITNGTTASSAIEIGPAEASALISLAAQTKATDTAGQFLVAYPNTADGVSAAVHSATPSGAWGTPVVVGASTTPAENSIKCALTPNGNGLVIWKNGDSELEGAIYQAQEDAFDPKETIIDGVDEIINVQAGSDNTFTIIFTTTNDSELKVFYSVNVTPTGGVSSPVLVFTGPSTNFGSNSFSINPRGTRGIGSWIFDDDAVFKVLSSATSGNHGASSGNLFRKSGLRPMRRPYR